VPPVNRDAALGPGAFEPCASLGLPRTGWGRQGSVGEQDEGPRFCHHLLTASRYTLMDLSYGD
jgi:hypothetical protein